MQRTKKIPFLLNLSNSLANSKKTVVYVAGKVTGLPEAEYQAKFKASKLKLESQDYHVINPCDFVIEGTDWQHAMRLCLPLLCMADVIYLQADWQDSEGAKIEHATAVKFGIHTIYE